MNVMCVVVGKFCDVEFMIFLKDMMNKLGVFYFIFEGLFGVFADVRSSYFFNFNLVGVEDVDYVLLIGINL